MAKLLIVGGCYVGTLAAQDQSDSDRKNVFDNKVAVVRTKVWESWNKGTDKHREFVLSYDRKGSQTMSTLYQEDGTPFSTLRFDYAYDNAGRILEVKAANGSSVKKHYKDAGKCVSEEAFDSNGATTGRVEYTYDQKGNLVKARWFDGAGNLTKSEDLRYNEKNQLIELSSFDGRGSQAGRNTYEYNDDGNVTLEVDRDASDNVRWRTTYKYKGQHLAVKTQFDKDGTVVTKTSYFRNARGMVAEEIDEDGMGRKTTDRVYEYEYYDGH